MKKTMLLAAAVMAFAAAPAAGQTISQGMTVAQVRGEFGAPATTREAGDWTYWYYHNGCPNRCGSDDVVFFQNGRVVAAVLRTRARRFQGPAADDAILGTGGGTSSSGVQGAPAIVGGVRVESAAPPAQRGNVIVVPAPAGAQAGDPVPAREGRPGEPSTITIQRSEAYIVPPAGADAPPAASAPAVDAEPLSPAPADADAQAAAPAANTEATDTQGQTSIDRKNQRNQNDRRNEETATQRARRNDRRGNP